MVVVDDEITDCGGCYEAREREDVGDVVDVFVADGFDFTFESCGEFGGYGWGRLLLVLS